MEQKTSQKVLQQLINKLQGMENSQMKSIKGNNSKQKPSKPKGPIENL